MHYAIHKLHWSPSEIREWLDEDRPMQAFYIGSTDLKIEHDREEEEKARRKAVSKARRR